MHKNCYSEYYIFLVIIVFIMLNFCLDHISKSKRDINLKLIWVYCIARSAVYKSSYFSRHISGVVLFLILHIIFNFSLDLLQYIKMSPFMDVGEHPSNFLGYF